LYYPPVDLARPNRANRKGEQVLYCSTTMGTPFFEIKPTSGSYVALVVYRVEKELEVAQVGYTTLNLSEMNEERILPKWSVEKDGPLFPASNIFVDNYLAKTFVQIIESKQNHLYKLTTAISEILTRFDNTNGLLYPSIASVGLEIT